MSEILVVASKIKKFVKEQGLRTSKDFLEALSNKVDIILREIIQKVKDEGKKKTLSKEDFPS